MKKNKLVLCMVAIVTMVFLCSCTKTGDSGAEAGVNSSAEAVGETAKEGKVKVVASIFPEYDFLRQIGGDRIDLEMLLTPGAESHSYEPTPQDIKEVNEAKLFVYVGGDSDAWVESILKANTSKDMRLVTLMDCVETVEEEIVSGMTEEEEEESDEPEYDEHVWTSPRNAMLIVQKLCDTLCEIDEPNADYYRANTKTYIESLEKLDKEFKEVVDKSKRKEIIFGDRFPFRYFVDAYGLSYYAAFPGCSTDTDASASTIAFLTDKVKADKIPVVFHIELSNTKVCDSICEATGAKSECLNAVHNISKEDFEAGATYMDLMEENVKVLQEALN